MRLLFSFVVALLFALPAAGENRLAGEPSLYLRQHADNPVNWYPWGKEALERARDEGKPIFVSVGYAACHWCHVMAEESFESEAIAAQLNADFVAIKIDREQRPDLDEQFILVTSALTGSSGWPNSVFLTSEAQPFYAAGYLPPDYFSQVLTAVADAWKTDRTEVELAAFQITQRMKTVLDQRSVLGEITAADLAAAAASLITGVDEFYGGFGHAPKFPQENVLLFLLDQAGRTGRQAFLDAAESSVNAIVNGGIHDHVGGGFHRYSVEPDWSLPHFEKMLYNQALIGRVLLRSYSLTGNADHARAARRTFAYVLREMTDDQGAFFAAQDADTVTASGERVEGLSYTWTPEAFAQATDLSPDKFGIVKNGPVEGASVFRLQDSASATAAALGLDMPAFDQALDHLLLARAARLAPITDKKIILGWNAEMIATLAEASVVLDTPAYYRAAVQAAQSLLDRLDTESGLMRTWDHGQAAVPAQLTDYAALGRALIALHDYAPEGESRWLNLASDVAERMTGLFGDADGLFRLTETASGIGTFRPVEDTEVASGNAQALLFLTALDRRFGRLGGPAQALAAATALGAVENPTQRAGLLLALAQHQEGPAGPVRVSQSDAARVFARWDRQSGIVRIEIDLREGWHLNAHQPLEDYLIGLSASVGGVGLRGDAYPQPLLRKLGFSNAELALYEGNVSLSAPATEGSGPVTTTVSLQACNDEICLAPEEMRFHFW